MGHYHWKVRPLSHYDETGKTHSPVWDIGDATDVHVMLKVAKTGGTSPSLSVKGRHSIDGLRFEDLTGLGFTAATDATSESKSATADAYRYLQFEYDNSGTSPTATFEVIAFVKTRGAGNGGAPPTFTPGG